MALYESRVELRCSPQRAFEFLIRPVNMQSVAPPELGMVFVNPPEVIALGSKLIFKVQAHGFVQQIEHEVTRFEPITGFSEKMVKGPLGSWLHDYLLEPAEHGVTLVNKIAFTPPGGMLGMILTEQRLRDQLEEGYHHRSAALKKALDE